MVILNFILLLIFVAVFAAKGSELSRWVIGFGSAAMVCNFIAVLIVLVNHVQNA